MQRKSVSWCFALSILAVLTLPGCLIYVSTGPTAVSGATIVFFAIDERDAPVASLHVSVAAVDGSWRDQGVTASNGTFRCPIQSGVTRVRAAVVVPRGYVLASRDRWPREFDVPSDGRLQIDVRLEVSNVGTT
jgi:hypothetical protein